MENFQLHTPLRAWTSTTHRRWTWFYDEETKCLKKRNGLDTEKRNGLDTEFYFPAGNARTQSAMQYVRIGSGPEELSGMPASLQYVPRRNRSQAEMLRTTTSISTRQPKGLLRLPGKARRHLDVGRLGGQVQK